MFCSEHYCTYLLLSPLPITLRFPSCVVPIWVQVGDSYPQVVIMAGEQDLLSHESRYYRLDRADAFLSRPIDVRWPSRAETLFQRMVRDGHAKQIAWPHTRLRFRVTKLQLQADRVYEEWLARTHPPDGKTRIGRTVHRGY